MGKGEGRSGEGRREEEGCGIIACMQQEQSDDMIFCMASCNV